MFYANTMSLMYIKVMLLRRSYNLSQGQQWTNDERTSLTKSLVHLSLWHLIQHLPGKNEALTSLHSAKKAFIESCQDLSREPVDLTDALSLPVTQIVTWYLSDNSVTEMADGMIYKNLENAFISQPGVVFGRQSY